MDRDWSTAWVLGTPDLFEFLQTLLKWGHKATPHDSQAEWSLRPGPWPLPEFSDDFSWALSTTVFLSGVVVVLIVSPSHVTCPGPGAGQRYEFECCPGRCRHGLSRQSRL